MALHSRRVATVLMLWDIYLNIWPLRLLICNKIVIGREI